MTDPIVVSAVVLRRGDTVLTVRKRGTEKFMLVGGKPEPGESAHDAAVRECAEEVGLVVDDAVVIGDFVTDTANEPGRVLHSTVFEASLRGTPEAAAEIAEIRWVTLDETGDDLAPLLLHLLDLLRTRDEDAPAHP